MDSSSIACPSATLPQLQLLALLATVAEGQAIDEESIVARLVANAAQAAAGGGTPMTDDQWTALLHRVAAQNAAEDAATGGIR
jgi:hypothetical protein